MHVYERREERRERREERGGGREERMCRESVESMELKGSVDIQTRKYEG